MTIVMGLDQHGARITAEWVDTDTGEIGRTRVAPAHRATVRRFLERFRGRRLEVALEARTGWRFVVEELHRVGAVVDLAEPAETAERRGRKKRAKTDRADARLLRELVMTGRLPESWIAPERILDLRASVRLRHTLVDQRREWQQRIHAVRYHHGVPQRRGLGLLTADGRAWLARQPLPRTGARAGHRRACDDRQAGRPARADRQGAACIRAPPARVQGADGALRYRSPERGHGPGRARRRPAVLLLARRRPLLGPRRSRSANPTGDAHPAT